MSHRTINQATGKKYPTTNFCEAHYSCFLIESMLYTLWAILSFSPLFLSFPLSPSVLRELVDRNSVISTKAAIAVALSDHLPPLRTQTNERVNEQMPFKTKPTCVLIVCCGRFLPLYDGSLLITRAASDKSTEGRNLSLLAWGRKANRGNDSRNCFFSCLGRGRGKVDFLNICHVRPFLINCS